jgi:hypothetical protein
MWVLRLLGVFKGRGWVGLGVGGRGRSGKQRGQEKNEAWGETRRTQTEQKKKDGKTAKRMGHRPRESSKKEEKGNAQART